MAAGQPLRDDVPMLIAGDAAAVATTTGNAAAGGGASGVLVLLPLLAGALCVVGTGSINAEGRARAPGKEQGMRVSL